MRDRACWPRSVLVARHQPPRKVFARALDKCARVCIVPPSNTLYDRPKGKHEPKHTKALGADQVQWDRASPFNGPRSYLDSSRLRCRLQDRKRAITMASTLSNKDRATILAALELLKAQGSREQRADATEVSRVVSNHDKVTVKYD